MKRTILFSSCLGLSMSILGCLQSDPGHIHSALPTESATIRLNLIPGCDSECEVISAIGSLSHGESWTEVQQARERLINIASTSLLCRQKVIAELMSAMDRPNLDFKTDRDSFQLWTYGGQVLGDLRAAEALDLLLSHIGLADWFWSSSMRQQPALEALIRMGPTAVPKLGCFLKNSPDRNSRRYAIFCLTYIAGPMALRALEEAAGTEKDFLVKQFIRVSIKNLDNKQYRMKNNIKWYVFFLESGGPAR